MQSCTFLAVNISSIDFFFNEENNDATNYTYTHKQRWCTNEIILYTDHVDKHITPRTLEEESHS